MPDLIRTPDQHLRVFVSSTLRELAEERDAVKQAITQLHLAPVMFELGARPHPAISLYRAYLDQSHIFIGIYWQSYGWVAPGKKISGLEDEYLLSGNKPKLIYIKSPAPGREPGLESLISQIKNDEKVSYKYFSTAPELRVLVENDLALLLTERFEESELPLGVVPSQPGATPNNIPAQVTTFIGRDAEIASVTALFELKHVRLVTLTGPGGIGKTRLCLQVAERLLDRFKDGVWFIPLAEATDSALVISKVAEVLGVREGGSQSLVEGVKGFLRDKNSLLLLDNFEQVVTASPLVSILLESSPQLKIIVTSRALLNLRGEFEFQVPTMDLPAPGQEHPSQLIAECESIKMFIERVRAINPRFTLDDKNTSLVIEICRQLDGLPLAIELAAARVKTLSLDKLLSLLTSRLKLLTGGSRDLPERQQTLRNTLDWSVQLLNPVDQALFCRLSVFMGGFTLESAQSVCSSGEQNELDIIKSIETLHNNSLLQLDQSNELQQRFRMLETIRDFAQEKLVEIGALNSLQRRHAQYFVDKMNEVSPKFSTRAANQWLAWVDAERDNLRAAMAFCLTDEAVVELGPWLLIAMNWPWYRRGFLNEGRQLADRLLHTPLAESHLFVRTQALWGSGAMAMWQGDLKNAQVLLEESVAGAKAVEFPMMIAISLLFLGATHVNRGEDVIALQNLQESLEIFKQLAMPWYEAITLVHIANASLGQGEIDKARGFLDQARIISGRIEESWLHSFIMNNYGEVSRTEGDYLNAQHCYEESESLLRSMGDKGDLARLVHNLGCIAWHTGEENKADEYLRESLAMFIKLGNRRGVAECLASMAGLWADRGSLLPAARLLAAAQALLDVTGARWWPADRVEVERNKEKLQKSLADNEFEDAWEVGSKMDFESAIAYARQA